MKDIIKIEKTKWMHRLSSIALFLVFMFVSVLIQRWMETIEHAFLRRTLPYLAILVCSTIFVYGIRRLRLIFKGTSCKLK